MLPTGRALDTVCFHCQQAAELAEALKTLTPFAVAVRYARRIEVDEEIAREAFEAASQACGLAQQAMRKREISSTQDAQRAYPDREPFHDG